MGKRMSKKARMILLEAVIMRDGDICRLCRRAPVPARDQTLDHVNGRQRDDRLENLRMLCRGCNAAEGNRARHGGRLLSPATLPKYDARAAETLVNLKAAKAPAECPGARVPLRVSEGRGEPSGVDRRGWSSVEEAANRIMEPTYRLWLFQWVKAFGSISREDAIDAGAEYLEQTCGRASQQTVERYFRKVISTVGWLEERRGQSSEALWAFKPGLSTDDLEALLERRMKAIAPSRQQPAPEPVA